MNAQHAKKSTLRAPAGRGLMHTLMGGVAAMALVALAGTAMAQSAAAPATPSKPAAAASGPVAATLIFKNGRSLTGTILSETPLAIRFRGESHGIPFETEYQRSEILEVQRGAAVASAPAAKVDVPAAPAAATPSDASPTGDRVYVMELTGKFGVDIALKPLRDALRDARNQKANTLIIIVNNRIIEAESDMAAEEEQRATDSGEIDSVEPILSHLLQQMPRDWESDGLPAPRKVTWVRKALGGPAFIPLITKEIYFAPDGKLGGVGYMDANVLGIGGSRRVLEKWLAAGLQTAVGWVNHSGFPQPEELCRALTMVRDVYTLRIENGKPVIVSGFPANPGEILLTDDGEGPNADNIVQLARGEGNDVLTIDADMATMMGLSRGTVASQDELLQALGFTEANLVKSRADQIFENWSKGLVDARASLRRFRDELGEIQVEGDWAERRNARSAQIRKLEDIKSTLIQWSDGLEPRWLARNGFPVGQGGPNIAVIQAQQDQIRAAQLADRR